jgi:hypothetical protein
MRTQVLCASNEAHDKVEPVLVPEGVEVGERVMFEGFEGAPEPVLNPKKKLWEKIAEDLTTDAGLSPLVIVETRLREHSESL